MAEVIVLPGVRVEREPRDAGGAGSGTVSITVRVPEASMRALRHQARAMRMPVEDALGRLIAEWFPAGDGA